MSTYKLIQDIEAEDHILGPLSLRQFIFALIAALFYYLSFLVLTGSASFLVVLFAPPALFCTFFAFPFGKDQSTEVWALAKLRFIFKPRRRIWNQTGIKELVTITAPKKIDVIRTNGLSELEVKSRLSALANTLDTRGWAVKNVDVNNFIQPNPFMDQTSDRLIDVRNLPREVPSLDIHAADDIMDETNNPIAHQFESMITKSENAHRKSIIDQMNGISSQPEAMPIVGENYWFMEVPPPVNPGTSNAEQMLAEQMQSQELKNQNVPHHVASLQLPSSQFSQASDSTLSDDTKPDSAMTSSSDAAIISLASNNDLNVATLAREAQKAKDSEAGRDEVVIPLR